MPRPRGSLQGDGPHREPGPDTEDAAPPGNTTNIRAGPLAHPWGRPQASNALIPAGSGVAFVGRCQCFVASCHHQQTLRRHRHPAASYRDSGRTVHRITRREQHQAGQRTPSHCQRLRHRVKCYQLLSPHNRSPYQQFNPAVLREVREPVRWTSSFAAWPPKGYSVPLCGSHLFDY